MPALENEDEYYTSVVLKFPKDKLKVVEEHCKKIGRVRNHFIVTTVYEVAKNELNKNF